MIRAALLAAAALVALPGAAAAKMEPRPRYGGTVVIAAVGEPPSLNPILGARGWGLSAWLLAYPSAYEIAPDFTYRPSLVTHGTVEKRNPTVVTFHIRRNARWSDGRHVTAADVLTHCRLATSYGTHVCGRARLRAVDTKRLRATFDRPFPAWRGPFGAVPSHALEGVDFRTVWQTDLANPKTGRPSARAHSSSRPGDEATA